MLNGPFAPWPCFDEGDAEAVSRVLLSQRVNYWTGDEGREFEREFAAWTGAHHAVAVANGTLALDLALHALDIGPGHEVIVTPRTFLASVSAIVNAGATPVFADIERDSQNLSVASVEECLSPRTRAIVAVHLAGWPCDMDALGELAQTFGLSIIEDCAQAHGARYRGRSVGTFGDAAAWSFCQDKIMTTGGEGGMVTTDDPGLHRRMWAYKDHGKSWEAVHERAHPPGFRWLHDSFGTNWRMTEMQAVLGRRQLERMAQWSQRRRANLYAILDAADRCPGLRAPRPPEHIVHAGYKAYVFVRPERLAEGWSRDAIMQCLNAQGVPCFSGSCSEVYRERAFDNTPWRPSRPLPVARELGETSLMLLIHPTLTEEQMDKTCRVLEEVMARATQPALCPE